MISKDEIDRPARDLLCGSPRPITWARDRKLCPIFDAGRNQHGLIARENGLTEGDVALGLVLASYGSRAVNAVGLIGERFAHDSVFVAIQTAILSPLDGAPMGSSGHTMDWG
jgi:hypothetical protein